MELVDYLGGMDHFRSTISNQQVITQAARPSWARWLEDKVQAASAALAAPNLGLSHPCPSGKGREKRAGEEKRKREEAKEAWHTYHWIPLSANIIVGIQEEIALLKQLDRHTQHSHAQEGAWNLRSAARLKTGGFLMEQIGTSIGNG